MPSKKTASAVHEPNASSFDDVTREELEEMERLMMEELDGVQFRATQAFSTLAVGTADLAEQIRPHYEQGRSFVKEHPGIAALGGFALGMVLGGLLGRD